MSTPPESAPCSDCCARWQVDLRGPGGDQWLLCAHHFRARQEVFPAGWTVVTDQRAGLSVATSGHVDPGQRVERERLPDGSVRHCRYNAAARLSDGPDGQAGLQVVSRCGKVTRLERFDDGVRSDGANDEPAEVWFHANGRAASVRHRRGGLLSDAPGDTPAVRWFDEQGRLASATRFTAGQARG